ncbi:MAG TPA: F0F1 ATP synthase subunit B [Bacteroidota bacterium]|nr:F0F1 ATP synthase subunit B [Bacteroidota bacterium]
MLDPNPGLIVWTIVTFVLLLLVLRKFAWKPLLKALHDRESSIRGTLEHAENAKAEAGRILEENRRQLARAGEESQKILGEGRALGEKLKQEIVDQANRQSRRMVDQARLEIGRDKDNALAQLRREVATLALQAAGKILNETLDEKRHRALIDESLSKLPKN